ncbi:MAG TPA: hypothetical protein IAB31_13620 [Candidatus Choladousia intestinavium]|uniref:Uncharacterized protein n=1 Tax=Candidatus Choladousia intestinavium TaxID=2840727 RepID=A0A9D1AET8_9FIRM|nr:hypothetical protein [Candidatus Choladousia intestinavium]
MKNWIKDNFLASWTPFEKGLFLTDVLLLGILIGWLTSPLKGGLRFFSNNSWEIGEKDKEEQEQEEE